MGKGGNTHHPSNGRLRLKREHMAVARDDQRFDVHLRVSAVRTPFHCEWACSIAYRRATYHLDRRCARPLIGIASMLASLPSMRDRIVLSRRMCRARPLCAVQRMHRCDRRGQLRCGWCAVDLCRLNRCRCHCGVIEAVQLPGGVVFDVSADW